MNHVFYTGTTSDDLSTPGGLPRTAIAASPAETRHAFSRLGLSMLVLSFATFASQYGLDWLLYSLIPDYLNAWWRNWVLSLVPLYAVGLPFMLLALHGMPKSPHNAICDTAAESREKPRFGLKQWLLLLVIGFGCMYIGSLIGQGIMGMLTLVTGYPYTNALDSVISDSPLWMTFLATCICAPIGEEFIFRKLLIDRSRRFGDTVSILLSGFFFGLFHGNLFQFFYAFLLGMVLAYIYTRTGKLGWCVAMHAVVNLMGSIVIPWLASFVPDELTLNMTPLQSLISLALSLWSYGLIIAGITLVCVLWKRRCLSRGTAPLYDRNSTVYVLLNPGMLANYIVMCLLMILNLIPLY